MGLKPNTSSFFSMKPFQAAEKILTAAGLESGKAESKESLTTLVAVDLAELREGSVERQAGVSWLSAVVKSFDKVAELAFQCSFPHNGGQNLIVGGGRFAGRADREWKALKHLMELTCDAPIELVKCIYIGVGPDLPSAFGLARMRARLVALIHPGLFDTLSEELQADLLSSGIYPPDWKAFHEGLEAAHHARLIKRGLKAEIAEAGKSAVLA